VAITKFHAKLVWEGGEEDRRAHRIELSSQTLPASSAPAFGGDPSKADPEEMLAGALSSCHMLWFIALAQKEGYKVAAYTDSAEATLDDDRFTAALLRPHVEWKGEAPDASGYERLHHEAHSRCFISNSVYFPVEVKPR
jgi:organic hydroperoxide reductase OsmC/OhrA